MVSRVFTLLLPGLVLGLALPLAPVPVSAGVDTVAPPPRYDGESWSARGGRDFTARALDLAPQAGDSFMLVRCAALYRSVRLHAGRDALGAARWDHARAVEGRLARQAALVRVAQYGSTLAMARTAARSDIHAVARLYLARYDRSIAETGRPWSTDPLWAADNAACRTLLDRLR